MTGIAFTLNDLEGVGDAVLGSVKGKPTVMSEKEFIENADCG